MGNVPIQIVKFSVMDLIDATATNFVPNLSLFHNDFAL